MGAQGTVAPLRRFEASLLWVCPPVSKKQVRAGADVAEGAEKWLGGSKREDNSSHWD